MLKRLAVVVCLVVWAVGLWLVLTGSSALLGGLLILVAGLAFVVTFGGGLSAVLEALTAFFAGGGR